MEKEKIIVYGGSFNPPLNSHFSIAEHTLNEIENVQKVIFVPVNKQYPKEELIDNEHRFQMLKMVCDKNEHFEVSDIEIKSEKTCYTIDTLKEIQKWYPDKEICFLMGSDNLKELHNWHNIEDLLASFTLLCMTREGDDVAKTIEESILLKKYCHHIVPLNSSIKSNYSSSYVRQLLKRGKSARYLMPDEVLAYIEQNHLYAEK